MEKSTYFKDTSSLLSLLFFSLVFLSGCSAVFLKQTDLNSASTSENGVSAPPVTENPVEQPAPAEPPPQSNPPQISLDVFADEMSTCLLKNGGLFCWGENAHYQKLDGTTTNTLSPIALPGYSTGVTSFEYGFNFTCALKDGGVKCWGINDFGQLGNGTNVASSTPVEVIGLQSGSGVEKIVLGWKHACALLSDGGVKCWGDNSTGELGRGFSSGAGGYQSTADYVSGLTSGVDDIATGSAKSEHTCALINGGMKCWGYNAWGQLGDGTSVSKDIPTDVLGMGAPNSGVIKLAPSRYTTCAILTGNQAKCWGENGFGQLGNNNLGVDSFVPVSVNLSNLIGGEAVVDLGQGEDQGCLLTDAGAIYCWGRDNYGQLGDGTIGTNVALPQATLITSGAEKLSVGRYHACAILTLNKELKCWGYNTFGQLGQGNNTHSPVPLSISIP